MSLAGAVTAAEPLVVPIVGSVRVARVMAFTWVPLR